MPSLLNLDAVVIFTLSQSYSEAPPDFTEIEKSAEDFWSFPTALLIICDDLPNSQFSCISGQHLKAFVSLKSFTISYYCQPKTHKGSTLLLYP